MAWRYLVNQIIECEKQEIDLYQRIAEGAPTHCLREMVREMAEHEKRELDYWYGLLKDCDCGCPGSPYQAGPKQELK